MGSAPTRQQVDRSASPSIVVVRADSMTRGDAHPRGKQKQERREAPHGALHVDQMQETHNGEIFTVEGGKEGERESGSRKGGRKGSREGERESEGERERE